VTGAQAFCIPILLSADDPSPGPAHLPICCSAHASTPHVEAGEGMRPMCPMLPQSIKMGPAAPAPASAWPAAGCGWLVRCACCSCCSASAAGAGKQGGSLGGARAQSRGCCEAVQWVWWWTCSNKGGGAGSSTGKGGGAGSSTGKGGGAGSSKGGGAGAGSSLNKGGRAGSSTAEARASPLCSRRPEPTHVHGGGPEAGPWMQQVTEACGWGGVTGQKVGWTSKNKLRTKAPEVHGADPPLPLHPLAHRTAGVWVVGGVLRAHGWLGSAEGGAPGAGGCAAPPTSRCWRTAATSNGVPGGGGRGAWSRPCCTIHGLQQI